MSLAARTLEAAGIPAIVMGCAKDIVEYVVVPRFLFSDFPLGNAAGKPNEAASQAATLELALRVLETAPGPRTTVQNPQRWNADGLWKLEDPMRIDVVATEQNVLTEIGGVPFRGIVDRLERAPDGTLEVTDYKSGRAPSARYSDDRLKQVLLYSAAVAATTGEQPSRARLLYLGQKTVDIAVTTAAVDPVVDALGDTWARMLTACTAEVFEPRPGPLCGWCPYAAQCPEGQAEIRRRVELGVLGDHALAVAQLAAAS